jgi:hypothetical protein
LAEGNFDELGLLDARDHFQPPPQRACARQVALFVGRAKGKSETYSAKMKRKIDSELGRHRYGQRLGIVEPVFAKLRTTHRLSRFSHRGRRKVTTQWQLISYPISRSCGGVFLQAR